MSWQLFDRLAAFFRQNEIYRREDLFIDQNSLDKITSGGQLLNFANQNALLEQTNLQINRLERYKDFDQMDEVGPIRLALDLYAAEASLLDPDLKHAIIIKAKTKRVKEFLENFFYNTVLIDNKLRPIVRHLCKYGDFAAELIPNRNRTGIMNFKFMNIYNFTRIETKHNDLVGFFFQDQQTAEPVFLHPWQVMHLRLTSYENIYHPYGCSLLDGARKHFKQLRLMEDAALIYRITRAPEKRVFTIPVGNIPTPEVEQYIESIARQFKKKQFFDPSTGDVNERWHPLIQEDDFWLPQRQDGTGPTITTLPGAENLDDIKDIEYFKKNMVSALKVPFDRVGLGESQSTEQRSLAAVDPTFAKEVQWIQREVAIGLKKIAIVHMALSGFQAEEMREFDIHMTASSAIDELYRIETWQSRVNVIESLRATEMFPKKWILKRFTDMTEDEIDEMDEELEQSQQMVPGMGMEGMGMEGMGMGGPGLPPPPEGEEALPPGEPIPLELGGPGEAGPPGAIPVPESYNAELEKELLTEYAQSGQINESLESKVDSSGGHYETTHSKLISEANLNSMYDHIMNTCELDGLTIPDDENKEKEQVLVESYLDPKEIEEAKKNASLLLTEGDIEVNSPSDEITFNDLPARRVFIS